mmetsp:Transcript_14194/g.38083  ORF Transcript_14194/g.38083 Transcript_14194/m.38083 type:complete len:200 (-) Transcript_14194:309-908(-)
MCPSAEIVVPIAIVSHMFSLEPQSAHLSSAAISAGADARRLPNSSHNFKPKNKLDAFTGVSVMRAASNTINFSHASCSACAPTLSLRGLKRFMTPLQYSAVATIRAEIFAEPSLPSFLKFVVARSLSSTSPPFTSIRCAMSIAVRSKNGSRSSWTPARKPFVHSRSMCTRRNAIKSSLVKWFSRFSISSYQCLMAGCRM